MNFFGVKRKYDFANGSIFEGMLLMALPLLGIALLNCIPGRVMILFTGWFFGSDALASIGVSQTILTYFMGISSAVMVAANVVVAHACGKGDKNKVSAAMNTVLVVSLVIGVILAAVLMIFARNFMYNTYYINAYIASTAIVYLRISAIYVLFNTVLSALMGCMFAMGDGVRPLLITVAQNVVHIVMYIIAFGIIKMGVNAFAIIDALVTVLGLVLAVAFFAMGKDEAKLNLGAGFSGLSLLFALAVFVTYGAQTLILNVVEAFRVQDIGAFGASAMAAYSASNNVSSLANVIMTAFIPVIITMVAQASGAGKSKKAFTNAFAGIALSVVPGILISLVLLVFSPFVIELFTSEYRVIDMAQSMVRLLVIIEFFSGVMLAVSAATRGRGATVLALLTSGVSTLVLAAIVGEMTYGSYIMDYMFGYVVIALLGAVCSVIGFVLVNVIAIITEKPANAVPTYAAPAQNFDTVTGRPIQQANTGYNFDPMTGKPIQKANPGYNFDPMTGKPLNQQNDVNNDNSQYIDKY